MCDSPLYNITCGSTDLAGVVEWLTTQNFKHYYHYWHSCVQLNFTRHVHCKKSENIMAGHGWVQMSFVLQILSRLWGEKTENFEKILFSSFKNETSGKILAVSGWDIGQKVMKWVKSQTISQYKREGDRENWRISHAQSHIAPPIFLLVRVADGSSGRTEIQEAGCVWR